MGVSAFGKALVNLGIQPLHVPVGVGHRPESVACVEGVGVAGDQVEAPEILEIRMGEQRIHHPGAEAARPVGLEDEHVAEVGEGGPVGDGAGESGEGGVGGKQTEAE